MQVRALAYLLLLVLAPASPIHARACELGSADRQWVAAAIEVWSKAADALERGVETMPWTVLYDEHCAVHINPRTGRARADDASLSVTFGGKPVPVRSRAYRRRFSIPNGAKLTADAVAFTSLAKDGGTFFVMALPSVWRKTAIDAGRHRRVRERSPGARDDAHDSPELGGGGHGGSKA